MTHADRLTATERKIAEVLASEPQTVAFGTVAQVAQRAGTSGPSVVRLAVKLGYEGFVGLQADVQAELARQLGPARDRIRQRPPTDLLTRVQAAEQDNILRTLHGVATAALNRAIIRLADRHRRVWVLSAEMTAPIGMVLAGQLGQLRDGVTRLEGSEVAISRSLAGLEPARHPGGRRHPALRTIAGGVESLRLGARRGHPGGDRQSSLSSGGGRHGDLLHLRSGRGTLRQRHRRDRLANLLCVGVAARLRQTAPARLDAIEAAWTSVGALVAEPGGNGPLAGVDRIAYPQSDGDEPTIDAIDPGAVPVLRSPSGVAESPRS